MPTSIVKEGAIWIIRGDTRPIKDVLLEAGATWQAKAVRWEFAGESLPEAIQAALDGRRVLPAVEVVPIVAESSPVGEPDWDKLASVLIDLRDVLRGHETLEETTAWVKAVNAEARRLDQQWDTNIARKNAQAVANGLPVEAGGVLLNAVQRSDNDAFVQLASGGTIQTVEELVTGAPRITFYSVVAPKKIETRKKALKALIDADAVGIAQYNTSATRWSVLWSTGMVEIMDVNDLELASEERRAKLLKPVVGATVLYGGRKRMMRGTLLSLTRNGMDWIVELDNGEETQKSPRELLVIDHPAPPKMQVYGVKYKRISMTYAWDVITTESGLVICDDIAEKADAELLARLLNIHEIADLDHAKLIAEAWCVHNVSPKGEVLDLYGKVIGPITDKTALKLILSEYADDVELTSKTVNTECWWIDEDNSIFRDDDPVPDHFAVLRGPFTSQSAAEKALWVQVQG